MPENSVHGTGYQLEPRLRAHPPWLAAESFKIFTALVGHDAHVAPIPCENLSAITFGSFFQALSAVQIFGLTGNDILS
jgi:hypothetical protein